MSDLTSLSATQISREVSAGNLKAEDVVLAHLSRIHAEDPKIKAFISVLEKESLEAARTIDVKRAQGKTIGKLAGVPVAVKDNILVEGIETTCASKMLKGFRAPYDATVIEKLRKEDAIIIGKTNLDEFAMGSSTENSAFFKTKNPWNTDTVPGGSSGGSAAAVASKMCPLALASDTGGSIRQPAAFCGVVGIKPTYGMVSRYGLIAFASSLDQIGPMARTIADSALLLDVLSGHDLKDSTSSPNRAKIFSGESLETMKGLRVGLPREYFVSGLDPEVQKSILSAVDILKSLGAEIKEVSLPHTSYAVATYYIIAPSEASSNLARFDGVRYGLRSGDARNLAELYEKSRGEGFGPEVKRRIMLGTYALSSGYYDAYYAKAQKARTLITREFDKVFEEVDVLATPTAPTAAFKFGEKSGDPVAMYLSDIFTIPSNLAGNASLSIPCGLTKSQLPIGLQFIAPPFKEDLILRAAAAIEKARPFPALN
jgi:aspartyl-tRNA(Asn)/glutamyl-tRNA(Gln) amidotransferase subunit A